MPPVLQYRERWMSGKDRPATADAVPLLEVRALAKVFVSGAFRNRHVVKAVNNVSLEVRAGQSVGLVGESGSGKSTVARMIARLIKPTSGQILLKGRDVLAEEPRRASREYRHEVQMIFQDPFSSLNPVHTVGHHLERALRIYGTAGTDTSSAIGQLLDDVGLSAVPDIAGRYPHELSGGQRQRVAIARHLGASPTLIVADEPTSMVDVSVRAGILNLLDDLRRDRGIGLILITHDLASARYSTSRILVMYAGFIVESGASEDVIVNPQHPYSQLLVRSVPRRSKVASGCGDSSEKWAHPEVLGRECCPFAPRCPAAMAICLTSMPPVQTLDSGRWVRCHLFGSGKDAHSCTEVHAGE
jgi:peptide/nickel transport system ATP-binding protein